MDGQTGMLILYIIMGFFGFVTIVCGLLFWIFWRRRKLIFTNFLSDTGQWERKSWLPQNLGKTFVYDNETYYYDIKLCTRDKINRPIAHYYKGNPQQQTFNFAHNNKILEIGTNEVTAKDFVVLMTSKVIRDIFQDDEVMNMLMMIMVAVCLFGVAIIIIILVKKVPPVILADNNQTIEIIARGVKQAISKV